MSSASCAIRCSTITSDLPPPPSPFLPLTPDNALRASFGGTATLRPSTCKVLTWRRSAESGPTSTWNEAMEMNGGRSGRFGMLIVRPAPVTRGRGRKLTEMLSTSASSCVCFSRPSITRRFKYEGRSIQPPMARMTSSVPAPATVDQMRMRRALDVTGYPFSNCCAVREERGHGERARGHGEELIKQTARRRA